MDITSLMLTFKLAMITTLLLMIISIPIGYWLAYSQSRIKPIWEAVISLPIVLPPTVLGFYFLLAFGSGSLSGTWIQNTLGLNLIFSFEGLILASVLFSLPFAVHPIQAGLINLPKSLMEASFMLGKSKWQTLWYVLLPNIKPALITAAVLTFAHTIGEFGLVLMIGGSIPGETKVASISIYEHVESMQYTNAHWMSAILIGLSFIVLLFIFLVNRKMLSRR